MKRRNFLGSLVVVPLAATGLMAGESATKESDYWDWIGEETKILTEDFLLYIKWRTQKFDWRQMQCPADVFDGIPIIAKSRRVKFAPVTGKYSELNNAKKEKIIKSIVKELEEEFIIDKLKRFYFYQVSLTGALYDPENSVKQYGIMIRYAKTSIEGWNYYHKT